VESAAEGGCEPVTLAEADGAYVIDPQASTLEWIGRNLNNRHHGRIGLQGGTLVLANGRLSTGSVVLDMATLSNLDVADPFWRDTLISHLKSEDFFAVERFPTAALEITGWTEHRETCAQAPRGLVTGALTIRGATRPVEFAAIVAPQEDGSLKMHAALDLDRTLWGVCYGSGRLFERLGMHLVHDVISLELFVAAHRA
jgi:polyisoprenoid-binding protein YceI